MAAPAAVGQAPPSADDGAMALEARGLKVHFGGHNEALIQFGVAPLRTRRAPKPADPEAPNPPIPVPTPE